MEYILTAAICSYQSFKGSACDAAASAYFQQIQGQKVLDQVNKDYIDHLPVEVKQAGATTGAYYYQKFRIILHHGLALSMEFKRYPNLDEAFASSYLNYELTFP